MAQIVTLTDAELENVLQGNRPVLLLIAADDIRSDFNTAFKQASDEHTDIVFARINPQENPQAAERFGVSSKAVLVGWASGEVIVRRVRPWGTDVPLAIEMLQKQTPQTTVPAEPPAAVAAETHTNEQAKEQKIVDTHPVNVTDATFQTEVIDHELPVVVDFWAEWCGPCRMVAPILEKLAGEYAGKIRIAKVDVDANPQLAQAFQVMSIPTIMMFKERNIVFNQPGALPEAALRDLFDQLVALEIPKEEATEGTSDDA